MGGDAVVPNEPAGTMVGRTYRGELPAVTAHFQSSPHPSSRSGCRISGFPPPPKSVRTWQVPSSGESEAAKQGLSPAGNTTSPRQSFGVKWLKSRGFKGLFILVAAITLLVLVIQQLMR
jgi:hypothetical protein